MKVPLKYTWLQNRFFSRKIRIEKRLTALDSSASKMNAIREKVY
jgi:hypothetical protein